MRGKLVLSVPALLSLPAGCCLQQRGSQQCVRFSFAGLIKGMARSFNAFWLETEQEETEFLPKIGAVVRPHKLTGAGWGHKDPLGATGGEVLLDLRGFCGDSERCPAHAWQLGGWRVLTARGTAAKSSIFLLRHHVSCF